MRNAVKTPKIGSEQRVPYSLVLALVAMLFFHSCETIQFQSGWRTEEIAIDGKSDDWREHLKYFEEENIFLGLLNDEKDLYICMTSADRIRQVQIMGRGFILWFDPAGGKKKAFGIRFPVGRQEFVPPSEDEGWPGERPRRLPRQTPVELEILESGKDAPLRMKIEEARGISVDVTASLGMVVYELKVPLARGEETPYAVGAKPGATVGVGFEIPEMDRDARRQRMPGTGPGGMMPGGRRGGIGVGMGGMRMGGRGLPERMKAWATVRLSAAKSPEKTDNL